MKTGNRNFSKWRSAVIVTIGFGISLIAHAIGGYYFAPKLAETFSQVPRITIEMLASSSISPVIAIIFLLVTTKFIPRILITRYTITCILAGLVVGWIAVFLEVLTFGKESAFSIAILSTPRPYYYVNLFLLIVYGPFFEETLYRGYFFELMKPGWGNCKAFFLSSMLFVLFHGLWGGFGMWLFFIFLASAISTIMYLEGGLIAAITTHSFVNFYLMYLSMP